MIKKILLGSALIASLSIPLSARGFSVSLGASQIDISNATGSTAGATSETALLVGATVQLFSVYDEHIEMNALFGISNLSTGYVGEIGTDLRYNINKSFTLGAKVAYSGYSVTGDAKTTDMSGVVYGGEFLYYLTPSNAFGLTYTTGSVVDKQVTSISSDISQASIYYQYSFGK